MDRWLSDRRRKQCFRWHPKEDYSHQRRSTPEIVRHADIVTCTFSVWHLGNCKR